MGDTPMLMNSPDMSGSGMMGLGGSMTTQPYGGSVMGTGSLGGSTMGGGSAMGYQSPHGKSDPQNMSGFGQFTSSWK